MRQELAPLRRGDFRILLAEHGSGLIIYERTLGDQKVTVCIHCGKDDGILPEIAGTLYWADGLEGGRLAEQSFAVFVSRGV